MTVNVIAVGTDIYYYNNLTRKFFELPLPLNEVGFRTWDLLKLPLKITFSIYGTICHPTKCHSLHYKGTYLKLKKIKLN